MLLGDDAFALKPYHIKLYPTQNLTPERVFNCRLSRGGRRSENLFGILPNRWRIYHIIIMLDLPVVTDITLATLPLHCFDIALK